MDRNPSSVTCREPVGAKMKNRCGAVDDGGGENRECFKCSGQHCSSCTATLVADCIAVCCCPCAIVNVLVLAFVKVPWMMGRRCLGFVEKKRRRLERKSGEIAEEKNGGVIIERRRGREEMEEIKVEIGGGVPLVDEGFEAEKVWLELYDQVEGVSFYGNQGKV